MSIAEQEPLACRRCQTTDAEIVRLHGLIEQYEMTQVEMGARIAQLEDELAGRERQLRREGATVVALQRQLSQVLEEEPGSEDVKKILSVWMTVTGRASRKGKKPDVDVSGKRGQVVKKAFKLQNVETGDKYTVGDLTLAVTGLGLLPFVGPKGRHQSEGKRYDDIEHCLRDEPTIDRFMDYARRAESAADSDAMFRVWQQVAAQEQVYACLALEAAAKRGVPHLSLVQEAA